MHFKNYIKKSLITILALVMALSVIPFAASAAAPTSANVKEIYEFLMNDMGLNSAAACGVLANIEKESNFNPTLYGDSGSSFGICQWHNSRLENLKAFCNKNGYSWKSLEGQLEFLKYELNTNKTDTGKIIDRLNVPNTAEGAYTAGYNWCYYFERPANKEAKSEGRGNNAKNIYWPTYKLVYNLGDVNEDSKVNSADALATLEYTVGKSTLTASQLKAADVDKDGKATSKDALIIISISTGKVSIKDFE